MQLTNIKRQPIFQAVFKSRDIFLHACTAYVFSNVYRVFIKSSPLGQLQLGKLAAKINTYHKRGIITPLP